MEEICLNLGGGGNVLINYNLMNEEKCITSRGYL